MTEPRTDQELQEFQEYVKKIKPLFKELGHLLKNVKEVALYSEMLELKHHFEQLTQDINLDLNQRKARYIDMLKSGLLRAAQELEEALKDSLEQEISAKPNIDLYTQEERIREIREQVDKLHPDNFKLR
jgi:hypothetical protein